MFNSKVKRILITGGGGFIGGEVIRLLLKESNLQIFNLDKVGYASDFTGINNQITNLGKEHEERHQIIKADLTNYGQIEDAIIKSNPDGVFLSNGPGDPSAVSYGIKTVSSLLGKKPIFRNPGEKSLSFDEQWIASLINSYKSKDQISTKFLINSRVENINKRSYISFLIDGLVKDIGSL